RDRRGRGPARLAARRLGADRPPAGRVEAPAPPEPGRTAGDGVPAPAAARPLTAPRPPFAQPTTTKRHFRDHFPFLDDAGTSLAGRSPRPSPPRAERPA